MRRYRGKSTKLPFRPGTALLAAGMALLLGGCGEGPDLPRPPHSPPRPVTDLGQVSTAHLVLDARPVRPKPGMM
ncbi:MAG TPA: hypothetical protein VEC01_06175 [Noviherbaspirillum sp.]|uniref:hypothetical protein n=1 Tax=Noviherbaspirillum sp. TaxID=1926288 RepID=UPI002D3DB15F|nr:hypothetical protein [Noviherbaspirillum sp.]HYD94893.1 hypothetical protein [Noviherbaspirillum sp.]